MIAVLLHFGFNETFTKWIMSSISLVSFGVVVNGGKSKCFKPGKGLRQGDPLSHYLFILGQEVLSRLIEHDLKLKKVVGIKTSISGPTISHVMYADDIVLFSKAMIATKRDSLCIRILRAKYKVKDYWLRLEAARHASPIWKAIEKAREVVQKGACFIIGDRESVDVWLDPLVP